MTFLDMALHHHSIGITPVLLRGKVPIESGWQSYKQTEADIKNKFKYGYNIGACCGAISGGLEDLVENNRGL